MASSTDYLPSLVAGIDQVIDVDCGMRHTCALRELASGSREVWCWGRNNEGQLGNGFNTSTHVPQRVLLPPGVDDIEQIAVPSVASDRGFSAARTSSQQLYTWGNNSRGQLGDGTTSNRNRPVLVPLSNVLDVALGFTHACAIVQSGADREVVCWGNNGTRQLGNSNTSVSQWLPGEAVTGITDAVSVSAGGAFSCALRSGTTIASCWGYQLDGRLGNGMSTAIEQPPQTVLGL